MLGNYLQQSLDEVLEECKILPFDCPMRCRYMEITFSGFKEITFSCENETFHEMLKIVRGCLSSIVEVYKKKNAFMQPVLAYHSIKHSFVLRVGLLPLEDYKILYPETGNV